MWWPLGGMGGIECPPFKFKMMVCPMALYPIIFATILTLFALFISIRIEKMGGYLYLYLFGVQKGTIWP